MITITFPRTHGDRGYKYKNISIDGSPFISDITRPQALACGMPIRINVTK